MRIKRSAKLMALLVAVSIIFGSAPLLAFAQSDSDYQGHWAREAIGKWAERKIVEGYPDGTFKPDNPITRAEFVALINRTFGFTTFAPLELSGMSDDVWFAEDASKALGAGYVEGYPDGTFKPNANISRQEAAVILARILGLEAGGNVLPFEDSHSIPDWSKGAVAAVTKAGIIKGHTDGSFDPVENFTRAETVIVLDRIFAEVFTQAGKYGSEDKQTVIDGNAVILVKDVELINYHIKGNLLVAESVDEGTVLFEQVLLDGELLVSGGGANSVYLKGCKILSVVVDKNGVRIVIQDDTEIKKIHIGSPSIIEQDADGKNIQILMAEINVNGVTLINVKISGDLVIGTLVGEGEFTLENVVVEGDIVSSSGEIIEDPQPPLSPTGGDVPSTVGVSAIIQDLVGSGMGKGPCACSAFSWASS